MTPVFPGTLRTSRLVATLLLVPCACTTAPVTAFALRQVGLEESPATRDELTQDLRGPAGNFPAGHAVSPPAAVHQSQNPAGVEEGIQRLLIVIDNARHAWTSGQGGAVRDMEAVLQMEALVPAWGAQRGREIVRIYHGFDESFLDVNPSYDAVLIMTRRATADQLNAKINQVNPSGSSNVIPIGIVGLRKSRVVGQVAALERAGRVTASSLVDTQNEINRVLDALDAAVRAAGLEEIAVRPDYYAAMLARTPGIARDAELSARHGADVYTTVDGLLTLVAHPTKDPSRFPDELEIVDSEAGVGADWRKVWIADFRHDMLTPPDYRFPEPTRRIAIEVNERTIGDHYVWDPFDPFITHLAYDPDDPATQKPVLTVTLDPRAPITPQTLRVRVVGRDDTKKPLLIRLVRGDGAIAPDLKAVAVVPSARFATDPALRSLREIPGEIPAGARAAAIPEVLRVYCSSPRVAAVTALFDRRPPELNALRFEILDFSEHAPPAGAIVVYDSQAEFKLFEQTVENPIYIDLAELPVSPSEQFPAFMCQLLYHWTGLAVPRYQAVLLDDGRTALFV